MVAVASKGTLLLRDLAVTVTPSSGALVSSKTLPLRVVFSTTEMSDVGAAVGPAEEELGEAVGLAEVTGVGVADGVVGVGVADGVVGVGVADGVVGVGVATGAEAVGEVVGEGLEPVLGAGPQATSIERVAETARPPLIICIFCMSGIISLKL